MNKKQIFYTLSLGLILSISLIATAYAANDLEVDYPSFGYVAITSTSSFSTVIMWVFYASLGISGLVVFGSLVYGGFKYQTSLGNPSSQKDAKDQILSSLLGLTILLSSYLILTTINPQLTRLTLVKDIASPVTFDQGIFVKYQGTGGTLLTRRFLSSVEDFGEARNKIVEIKIVNPDINRGSPYSIILHRKPDRKGQCQIYFSGNPGETTIISGARLLSDVSSMTVFWKADKASYGGTQICSKADQKGECLLFEIDGTCSGAGCTDPAQYWHPLSAYSPNLTKNVWSVGIDGPFLLGLKSDKDECVFFPSSVADLKDHPVGKCDEWCLPIIHYCWYKSCAQNVAVFPLGVQFGL